MPRGSLQFHDRTDAGRTLARLLEEYADNPAVLVLALPRGGVPVAYEVAQALHAPLDVFVARKLGMPGHEEYAIGAIASGGVQVMNADAEELPVTQQQLRIIAAHEQRELERREHLYRGNLPPLDIAGRVVLLIDDGLATGSTMRAAATAVRERGPRRIVVAVPVAAAQACEPFSNEVDGVVCALAPEAFWAVGAWYRKFEQVSDDEVRRVLDASRRAVAAAAT